EARLGTHIDEHQATRIFTLGELLEAFEAASSSAAALGTSWKEILETATIENIGQPGVFANRPLLNPLSYVAMRAMKLFARMSFRLRCFGLEKLPRTTPFLLCPNHQSFLDGPLLVSLLPRQVIYNLFILGYSD